MVLDRLDHDAWKNLEEILGYLNFSEGAVDFRFLRSVNELFGRILAVQAALGAPDQSTEPCWRVFAGLLKEGLGRLRGQSSAFEQADQAQRVIQLVFEEFLPAYRRHHRDLLFHQTDESLFQPFFLARACEAVLVQGSPWEETDRIITGALQLLNDFVGHRPLAVLEGRQRMQPYAHERVRPIPLFIQEAGVAVGRYHDLLEKTLEIIRGTDEDLLRQAWFDPALMEELAVDPRAYDFDHPVNRRPNYHFGGWDPHRIDNRGHYRRFVVQQVTLDALFSRVTEPNDLPFEERLYEAAAVLAGTMLMGSGVTGNRPESHDSTVTLASLLPQIAAYRDEFYQRLLARMSDEHARRLRAEAKMLLQPFGAARQHLNQKLARCRAEQLQHVRLAQLFARIGYTEAAERQVNHVPVASARMRCDVQCRLSTAHLQIDRGDLDTAAQRLPEIEDLLHRAIACGAMADPWNMLGFGGQFSLFPAVENSVRDHRIDQLIDTMDEIFGLYARLEKEAAASGRGELQQRLSRGMETLARWWDQFGSIEISDLEGVSGMETWESAGQVSAALAAWRAGGTAAGDVAFWRQHVEQFHSPKAYALLVEALLDHRDPVAAMALLVHWLGQGEEVPLDNGSYSFFGLAVRWMHELWHPRDESGPAVPAEKQWPMARKFLDFLEANAEEYWQAPQLDLTGGMQQSAGPEDLAPEVESEEDDLFSAAYENVTYRDSTDDGFEGQVFDAGPPATDTELSLEAERISRRLAFLATIAQLWKQTVAALPVGESDPKRDDVLAAWLSQAVANYRQLEQLLAAVERYRIPRPRGTHESLVEYDRHRSIKEALLERVVAACLEMADAARLIRWIVAGEQLDETTDAWEPAADRVFRAVLRGDAAAVRKAWPAMREALGGQTLLYVPTTRGGSPPRVVRSRSLQRVLGRLLGYLPRLGMLWETYDLLRVVHEMERSHPVGAGAITEYDRLFEIGCRGIVGCLVVSAEKWPTRRSPSKRKSRDADLQLIECMERAVELLLHRWLAHSRNIRISVLETVADRQRWRELKRFIEQYGRDLFTQQFMNLGNLRAILHQGVDTFLESLTDEPGADEEFRLLADLDHSIAREDAVRYLELTIESVVENYSEYIDYNSTTTQSDRGDLLYTLLDFLRIQASYDRVAWNLKPVVIAHEVLVRQGRNDAATLWRRAVARRSQEVADDHLQRLGRLSSRYGMRLPSVADRLRERFIQPLAIDRVRALVKPAIEELHADRRPASFQLLEQAVSQFTEEPSGVGFDLPSWLEALEDEVERIATEADEGPDPEETAPRLPQVRLSLEEVERQLEKWAEK
ncbi:MAG: hypothetical protein GXY83_44490 [Rhodopirellula sp.]|nr:hypothetical protein [Rhodopirellula sp.]